MLKPILITLALALSLSACTQEDKGASNTPNISISATPALAVADPATSTYQDLNGKGLELSAYAGKKVFVNYWATWCAPCIREIPSIIRAANTLEADNYIFLMASDESLETINNFLLDRGFSGNFIKLNGYFGSHGIDAVPSSILLDEAGKPINSWAGSFEWDSPQMLEALRQNTQ